MMTFADLEPGATLGMHHMVLAQDTVDQWTALFPDDQQSLPTMPAAMTAMILMRAFTEILSQRPRGNIHAGQKFWISRLPHVGDEITTTLRCIGKEEKNGRRWVTFSSNTNDTAGRLLFRGQTTTIWAA
jgi:hypothetical protein